MSMSTRNHKFGRQQQTLYGDDDEDGAAGGAYGRLSERCHPTRTKLEAVLFARKDPQGANALRNRSKIRVRITSNRQSFVFVVQLCSVVVGEYTPYVL